MIAVDPCFSITQCFDNGRWVELCKFPNIPSQEVFAGHHLTVANGRLYLAGGSHLDEESDEESDETVDLNHFYQYDRLHNKWIELSSMITRRGGFTMVHLNDHIYAIGGKRLRQFIKAERYDLLTGEWEAVANLPVALTAPSAVAYNGKILVYGVRRDRNDLRTVYGSLLAYDPESDTWTQLLTEIVEDPFPSSMYDQRYIKFAPVLVVENDECYRVKYVFNVAHVNRLILQLDNTAPYTGQLCSPHTPSDQSIVSRDRHVGTFCINKRLFLNLHGYIHRLEIILENVYSLPSDYDLSGWAGINEVGLAPACVNFTFDKYRLL